MNADFHKEPCVKLPGILHKETQAYKEKPGDQKIITITCIIIAIIFGAVIRLAYLTKSDFPVGDGGLFFTMVEDLIQNSFRLPLVTTYNSSEIPFVYPPLGIFLTAFIHHFLRIDILEINRFLPLFFNLLVIPAAYYFGFQLLQNNRQAIYATFIFAFLSPSFEWLIMGGGITRSPAYLFAILSLGLFLSYVNSQRVKKSFFGGFFAGLTGLSHLEIFWFLLIGLLIIIIFYKSKISLKPLLMFIGTASILVFPYLIYTINGHGLLPFIYAFRSGEYNLASSIGRLVVFYLTDERVFTLFSALGLIGLIYSILTKQYFLPLFVIALVFLDRRSTSRSVVLPVSLLAAIAIDEIIYKRFRQTIIDNKHFSYSNGKLVLPNWVLRRRNYKILWATILIIFAFLGSNAFFNYYSGVLNSLPISPEDREVMQWISEHTPKNSRVYVQSGANAWHNDYVAEWFPAIANRVSVTTVQGTEWLSVYHEKIDAYNASIECRYADLTCIRAWAKDNNIQFEYILLASTAWPYSNTVNSPLLSSLLESNDYIKVYNKGNSTLFQLLNSSISE